MECNKSFEQQAKNTNYPQKHQGRVQIAFREIDSIEREGYKDKYETTLILRFLEGLPLNDLKRLVDFESYDPRDKRPNNYDDQNIINRLLDAGSIEISMKVII